MKVAILGIGTELTDGQIVNRNAPWISQKLKAAGISTSLHLVVPDERRLMREGLELCAGEAEVIFVTGGLGPTTDDFTRDIIAEWMGASLEFHQASWDHINERLSSRGYAVKEIQRQQCYFPQTAEVLFNTEGTANAFKVKTHGKTVFVLPGPPREIEAVWKSSIAAWLTDATKNIDKVVTRVWETLGRGESDIATLAEEALQGLDVEKGYRVHLPYVEVKMTYKKSEEEKMEPWIKRLDTALEEYTVLRDDTDIAETLAHKLETISSLKIVDQCTRTYVWQRLSSPLRSFMEKKTWDFSNSDNDSTAELELRVSRVDDFSGKVSLIHNGKILEEKIQTPYKTSNMQERARQYIAEKALIFWTRNLP